MNNIGLSMYNPGIKSYFNSLYEIKNKTARKIIYSLLPMGISFTIAIVFPNVLGLFWIAGLTVANFNGFIIPAWMELAILKKQEKK